MNNTAVLCFVLGWQGGTVHQVAETLKVPVSEILDANELHMGILCRKTQKAKWEELGDRELVCLLHKQLTVCVDALKADYAGHLTPPWLQRAEHVNKIVSEIFN